MKPLWKQVFDRVEQTTGPALADFTASNHFAEILKVGLKISNDMTKQTEALSRQWLHAWNLPAAGDVAYLKNQIGSLETEVRALRRTIEQAEITTTAPAPAIPLRTVSAKAKPTKPSSRKPQSKRTPKTTATTAKPAKKSTPTKKSKPTKAVKAS